MKKYLLSYLLCFAVLIGGLWIFTATRQEVFSDPDLGITRAHNAMIDACNIGDMILIGDSTAVADYIPALIGPNVRTLALGGASPLETYYILARTMKCKARPKAIVLSFTPFKLARGGDDGVMWSRYEGITTSDIFDARKIARQLGDTELFGTPSLLDIDAFSKTVLNRNGFPSYYFGSLLNQAKEAINGTGTRRESLNRRMYQETLTDQGRHFYGNRPEAIGLFDAAIHLHDFEVDPIADYYFRRIISEWTQRGVDVYFNATPRNQASFARYDQKLITRYNSYLKKVAQETPKLNVLAGELVAWPNSYFGDDSHLNLHGAQIQSVLLRKAFIAAGRGDLVDSDDGASPQNLFSGEEFNIKNWRQVEGGVVSSIEPVANFQAPKTFYPFDGSVVKYSVIDGNRPEARLNPQLDTLQLSRNTDYVATIFAKAGDASAVDWRMLFVGQFDGRVTWDFRTHKVGYGGSADPLNSGVDFCGNGWVRLWIRATTGPAKGAYEAPVISLPAEGRPSVYLAGASLEQARYPADSCRPETAQKGASASDDISGANVYAEQKFWLENWRQVHNGVASTLERAADVVAPATKEHFDGGVVKYTISGGNNAEARLTHVVTDTVLRRNTEYTASILVKPEATPTATWRLLLLGRFDGRVIWDTAKKQLAYEGQANPSNSGFELCNDGWVRLWVRGATGNVAGAYEGPVFSLAPEGKPSAYLADASLLQGSGPASDCGGPNPPKDQAGAAAEKPEGNAYAEQKFWLENWRQVQPGVNATIKSAVEVAAPKMKDKVDGGVIKYAIVDGNNAEARLTHVVTDAVLGRNTDYTASILVKPDASPSVTWRLLFLGQFDGRVIWDSVKRQIAYEGQANPSNSGYELCNDGWVRLWVRGTTGKVPGAFEGPIFSLPPEGKPSAYLANAALWSGKSLGNSCAAAAQTPAGKLN